MSSQDNVRSLGDRETCAAGSQADQPHETSQQDHSQGKGREGEKEGGREQAGEGGGEEGRNHKSGLTSPSPADVFFLAK